MVNNVTTPRCPYCLQTKPGSTPTAPSLPGDAQEDVLDAEIERIEKLISSLLLESSRLRRKRNEMRSPIYSLPQEILTLIFKFACPPVDFLQMYGLDSFEPDVPAPRIMAVLAAVSVRWHNVVSSMPSLWASFVADDRDINAMQTVFARSGNLPIVASLELPVHSVLREPHMDVLTPVLQKNASRVRMLSVLNASPIWLNEYIPSCVNLDLLCLGSFGWDGGKVVIDSPCTSLVLKCVLCDISLSWSKIEVLHVGGMSTYDCCELLRKCPRLREYRLRDPADTGFEGGQLPSSPFILPCLELFEWMVVVADPVDRAVFKYIRMPALRTLVWNEDLIESNPLDFLSNFFEHLPSTVSVVEVRYGEIRSNFSIFSYIMNLSSVERLMFGECSESFMDGVFSNLGSETRLVENQEMSVLPKLKSIYVDRLKGNFDQARVLQALQCTCSQSHQSLQGSPFRLEFARHYVDWTPESKKELIKMVEKGYKVELWEDSKPVDWLPR